MRPYKNIISVKKTIFILAIVSTLLVSAKGTLSHNVIGNGYHQYNVERVDTLHKVAFNDSAFETIIEDVVTTINYAELSERRILFVTTIAGNTDSLLEASLSTCASVVSSSTLPASSTTKAKPS